MKYLKNIPILLLPLILSCEQVAEIDLPYHKPQITLSCHYQLNYNRINAYLTSSSSISSSQNISGIDEATIEMYENSTPFLTLKNSDIWSPDYLYTRSINEPLQAGNTYKITAEAEGFESVSATQIMPDAPVFDLVTYTNGSNIIIDEKEQDIYEIALYDEGGIDNYYEFKIYTNKKDNSSTSWNDRQLRSRNSYLKTYKKSMYLKDDTFDGETYHIELLSNKRDTTIFDIKVEVSAITRDKYLFVKSIAAYFNAEGNPFAEPVIVHTNIENGQGLFSLQNSTEILIE